MQGNLQCVYPNWNAFPMQTPFLSVEKADITEWMETRSY